MAANFEHQFLCKIIETGDFHTVEKMKVDESYFLGDQTQYKEIFRWMRACFHNPNTYGSVPSFDLIRHYFPGLTWVNAYDTVPTLCQHLRHAKLRAEIVGLMDEVGSRVDADPVAALAAVKEASTKLVMEHEITNDALLSSAVDQIQAEYQMVQAGQGLTGIPWPWPALNEDTLGIHEEDFIIIFGRPKSMKSWVAFLTAVTAYYQYRQRVLIFSMEMSRIQCLRRCAAIIAKVDYEKFRSGRLDPASHERLFSTLGWLKAQEDYWKNEKTGRSPALMVSSPSEETDGAGISSLRAKIREFQPNLVIVDGMYLMKDDRDKKRTIDWKAIAHISQDLKSTARSFKVPIIGVTQANRTAKNPNEKEADLAELAYADALAQDCDLAMRVHKQKDKNTGDPELVMSIPGSREGKLDVFVIHGSPAVNFEQKRLTIKDPDAPDDQGQKNGASKGPTRTLPTTPQYVQRS